MMLALLGGAGVALAQGDGREGRPPRRPLKPEEWVARLDRDQDGRVSAEEFDGPPEHFAQFDKNRDGYLEASEARGVSSRGSTRMAMARSRPKSSTVRPNVSPTSTATATA